jgi:hypothetical protein
MSSSGIEEKVIEALVGAFILFVVGQMLRPKIKTLWGRRRRKLVSGAGTHFHIAYQRGSAQTENQTFW